MQHTLQKLLCFAFLFFAANSLKAFVPQPVQPVNDTICDATDLGTMPSPGFCPNNPFGDTILFTGSTVSATYNPLEFSATHCFPSPSPDVWYKLRATGSFLYVEIFGYNGLNDFFAKLHHSQGTCLSLVPLDCQVSFSGVIYAVFATPVVNGEYYLQIGGSMPTETGDFSVKMKSYNDCDGCVKQGNVELSPAPTTGRYNLGETVTMCATVTRWESLSSSYLHSIVPVFGPDWDLATLTPVSTPNTISSANSAWYWMNNISTPNGTQSGFFFDNDNDGDPSNNPGDDGNVLSSWTGCWKITTNTQCLTNDVSLDVHFYSDAETGNGSPSFVCNTYYPVHISTSTSCCTAPSVSITAATCNAGDGSAYVLGDPAAPGDVYNYTLVDTAGTEIQYSSVTGGIAFNGLFPGQYTVYTTNTNTSCIGFQTFTISPGLTLSTEQTLISCMPNFGQAMVSVVNGVHYPYTYNWINITSTSQNDSVAINLPDGWVTVSVTDNVLGCTVTDSVFIVSDSLPDALFEYPNEVFCVNADSIIVQTPPASGGGVFSLVSPTTSTITVDPATGLILLNNTTLPAPFWVIVKYDVGTSCTGTHTDSVEIVAVPTAPVPVTPQTAVYCIGGIVPAFTVTVPANMYAIWYDAQTGGSAVFTTYTPPLSAASTPGQYFYFATTFFTLSGGCVSAQTVFVVNVVASPSITASADATICTGDTAQLTASGCASCNYQWSPAPTGGPQSGSVTYTSPLATTSYTVTATDATSGCFSADFTTISLDPACGNPGTPGVLSFYTGFTPNGDGHNDTWIIDGLNSITHAHVEIYNRWGKSIWRATDYDNSTSVWNGLDENGSELPDGTYYYVLTAGDFSKAGWIELSH